MSNIYLGGLIFTLEQYYLIKPNFYNGGVGTHSEEKYFFKHACPIHTALLHFSNEFLHTESLSRLSIKSLNTSDTSNAYARS
jgi:hypothetical protein